MIELAEGYDSTVKKMKTFKSYLDVTLSNNERGRSTLSSFKSSEDFKYETERQKILKQEKALKDEVEMLTKKLLKELDQRWNLLQKSVNNADNKSKKINKNLEFRTESLSIALASANTGDVFRAYKKEKTARKQSIEPVNTNFKRLPQYVPGKTQIQQALHGNLTESDDIYSLEHYKFNVITKFNTGLKQAEMVFICADGTMWISNFNNKILQKLQFSNELVKVVQKIHVSCAGMALLPSGDLLISTTEPSLKILSHTTGKITSSKYSVAPLITGHIHITSDNKIIIRAGKKGSVFPMKDTRQVVVMDIEGRTEKVYELDNNGKPIFYAPQRITSDTDNNLYVLDRLNKDKSGMIMALNKSDGVRWIYSGNPDINKGQVTFKPHDLVSTKLNYIIITDMDSDMIHILNISGQCIYYLNTKDQLGILYPYSLKTDKRGTLYIGCGTEQYGPNEANIYTAQFSGL
ncbi:unnamed protein product [Mytilus coruscus]|uniref:Uncharacterized protein n=1 Tax=Mytilus coruscus TaxID=42192 RepID=A0A6J8BHH2_MYTCO|nr:unnamed protein product [Mytilus coruscus]